ncbi:hypothetical protein BDZ89DRAFT_1040914 [Hymenopellis radicata]|nr:hypothetical protein BDZ89DRAFT_1040914 [Hymenopellis radicata]
MTPPQQCERNDGKDEDTTPASMTTRRLQDDTVTPSTTTRDSKHDDAATPDDTATASRDDPATPSSSATRRLLGDSKHDDIATTSRDEYSEYEVTTAANTKVPQARRHHEHVRAGHPEESATCGHVLCVAECHVGIVLCWCNDSPATTRTAWQPARGHDNGQRIMTGCPSR